MAWRGRTEIQDRLLSCLPYLLPLIKVQLLGAPLFALVPFLSYLYLPLLPFIYVYGFLANLIRLPFLSLDFIIFFALFLGVVRNEKLIHFLRFHTMQALLFGIFTSLCIAVLQFAGFLTVAGAPALPVAILLGAIFLVVFVASVYSIIQALRGIYAEIPFISEAAYAQIR
ncbi:MAG: Tic20 family protein [Cyanobacteria bacterium P01_A01_bin.45]